MGRKASKRSQEQAREVAQAIGTKVFSGYRFKGGVDTMAHPVIGTLTKDHLSDRHVIAGIKACDQTGRTKNWFTRHIEEV